MDRNFHIDEFERLLREKTDEFRMYPSKRTWHSIYNNIHPGRKWPSVAMCITLIGSLVLVGYLNTNTAGSYVDPAKASAPKTVAAKKATQTPTNIIELPPKIGATVNQATNQDKPSAIGTVNNAGKLPSFSPITGLAVTLQPLTNEKPREAITDQPAHNFPLIAEIGSETVRTGSIAVDVIEEIMVNNSDGYPLPEKIIADELLIEAPLSEGNAVRTKTLISAADAAVERSRLTAMVNNPVSPEDQAWMENYALYNRPATRKWANKLAWQTYFTPSVVYRELFTDPNFGNALNAAPPLSLSALNADVNNTVIQKPSYGIEIGTGVNYSVWPWLSLKAGLQFNYTRYNAEAYQNTHPVTTRITMHDYESNRSYEETRATPYSNKTGLEQVNLHNETIQLSIPLGLDVRLLGNKTLQWRIGATIQPTYVPAGKSYLISSDRRNYVKETSMINRWNLNAGFETFVSYKAPNGIRFDLGPQYRSQLFTTNNKQIAVEEKLYGIGLKFGVSTILK